MPCLRRHCTARSRAWLREVVADDPASLGVEEDEMRRVFNLGLGYAAVVAEQSAELALRTLTDAGQQAWIVGRIVEGDGVSLS